MLHAKESAYKIEVQCLDSLHVMTLMYTASSSVHS